MQQIAIYDLDRTIVKTPTFTAFLIFSARREGRSLTWRVPLWVAALIGYKLKLYGRKSLKQYGLKLFVGEALLHFRMEELSSGFAASVVPSDVQPGASAAMKRDRGDARRMVIASAAPEFYVREIARLLDFHDFVATRHVQKDGKVSHKIDGENCYGDEKLARVERWMSDQGLRRDECAIVAYSDHMSDAVLLDWADEGIFVTDKTAMADKARSRGWRVSDFGQAE